MEAAQHFVYNGNFELELGGSFSRLTIAYCTYGTLNQHRNNVIWICHALTASADAAGWWPGLVGPGKCFDTDKYFVVCANILGSCYGTTGPLSTNPISDLPFYHSFPQITIRDMVQAHQLLCRHLQISRIELLAGGSMGGYQVLEWCVTEPQFIKKIFVIATSAKESAWGKAIHATQRIIIETDATWPQPAAHAGTEGLKAARAVGMLTYRGYETFCATQEDETDALQAQYRAGSYVQYQGKKLAQRFNAFSYWYLTHAMDSHNIARGRGKTLAGVLRLLPQPALVMGINSDILCPVKEMEFLAAHLPFAQLQIIQSLYGHDGFLMETKQIVAIVSKWMAEQKCHC